MLVSKFDYPFDESLIAQSSVEPRDMSRLMVIDKESGEIREDVFLSLPDYLRAGDVLVFNQTKVLPARLFGKKTTGGRVEVLLIKQLSEGVWEVISKPGLKKGQRVVFEAGLEMEVEELAEEGVMCARFNLEGSELITKLYEVGKTPLPPYIDSEEEEKNLRDKYQTIYAKDEGSVAAPTAGFHFTLRLIEELKKKGIVLEYVTLHVSLGTFRPVKSEQIEEHLMHSERFSISSETAERLNHYKSEGRRIISVGTTTSRVLESVSDEQGRVKAMNGETDIFIYPPYKFRFVDGMITNFHLPKSTLLMLVSALVSKPNTDRGFVDFQETVVGKAYRGAVEKKYRFFSFGDGMLIV